MLLLLKQNGTPEENPIVTLLMRTLKKIKIIRAKA